jgi:CHAT domain-containing protein
MAIRRPNWPAGEIASHWPADDDITSSFMPDIHGALCRGMAPAASLALARRSDAAAATYPFYWAAFTLHGRW